MQRSERDEVLRLGRAEVVSETSPSSHAMWEPVQPKKRVIRGRTRPNLKLTARQRDCLVLVARGRTDRQVGEVLGISQQTVHKHVEAAKKRFGARTRIQLVVLALSAGQLEMHQITV
jgi:DNA-binding CsgD family transcriptional regulator